MATARFRFTKCLLLASKWAILFLHMVTLLIYGLLDGVVYGYHSIQVLSDNRPLIYSLLAIPIVIDVLEMVFIAKEMLFAMITFESLLLGYGVVLTYFNLNGLYLILCNGIVAIVLIVYAVLMHLKEGRQRIETV